MSRGGSEVTVYTLADGAYLPGLVGLVNSLRLQGHDLPVVALGQDVSRAQRELLGGRVELVELPPEVAERGYLAKSFLRTLDIRGIVLWIDSDIILTGRLDEAIEHARAGRFCAFRDDFPPGFERHFLEWEQLFDLAARPRRQTYVSAGLFAFSAEHWPLLIPRWAEAADRVPPGRMFTGDHRTNPFWAGDQDALNALLMSELPAEALVAFPSVEMAHTRTLREVRVLDVRGLRVEHQGVPARVVHYSWGPKPWMAADWRRIGPNAYVRLLQRVLFEDDVDLRLPPNAVPVWLRRGRRGWIALRAIVVARNARRAVGSVVKRLPEPVARLLNGLRDRVDARLSRR